MDRSAKESLSRRNWLYDSYGW